MRREQSAEFLSAILIAIVIIVLYFVVYTRTVSLGFFVGTYRASHWLSIAGTIYIAAATPIFSILKRRPNANYTQLTEIHLFGNLIAFGLITLHLAGQLGRPATNFPEIGTGLAMYIAMALQVASGYTLRFRPQRNQNSTLNYKRNLFIHASLVMVFYAVIIFHTLHGLGLT